MLLFLSFFVSVRSNVMFHGLELYFIPDSERGKYCIIYFHFRLSVCIQSQVKKNSAFGYKSGLNTNYEYKEIDEVKCENQG